MNDSETDTEAKQSPPPEGWVQVPALRGMYEIEPLLKLCDQFGGHVIGGYARFCCSPSDNPVKAGDVDIFPTGATPEESEVIFTKWHSALMAAGLKVKHENKVSITWDAEGVPPYSRCPTIQTIKPVEDGAVLTRGSVGQILESFDFTIVRIALNRDRETATAWASFLDDEGKKRLRILNIHCPISSLLRVMKYGRKGYYMRPIEAMKLFADWSNRSQEYRDGIAELFTASKLGELSKEEVDELERLLRVD